MELTLDLENSLVLEIRFSGELEACPSPGKPSVEAENIPVDEISSPVPPPASEEPAPERQERRRASRSARRRPAAAASAEPAPSPAPAPAAHNPAALPAELSHLPKKHQDFYARKFSEYLEVYPAEKARDLAIQAVRSIAGSGPRR